MEKFIIENVYTVLKYILIITLFQSLMITVFLLIQRKGLRANRHILAAYLISFCSLITGSFILLYSTDNMTRSIGHLASLGVLLAPPLLYLYQRSHINLTTRRAGLHLLHLLPFILIFSFAFIRLIIFRSYGLLINKPYGLFLLCGFFTQNILYLILVTRKFNRIKHSVKDTHRIKWLKFLLVGFTLIYISKLASLIGINLCTSHFPLCLTLTTIFFLVSFLLINSILVIGMNRPELLSGQYKYMGSRLNENFKREHLKSLLDLIDSEAIHHDPLISLKKVARRLGISDKQLSQIINELEGLKFNEFINKHRIESVIRNLSEEREIRIIDIAYDVGFNSKSTFNTAFKKQTGMTPTQFLEELRTENHLLLAK